MAKMSIRAVVDEVQMMNAILDFLESEGKRIIQECVNERGYTHRTYNLADSYGFGVYQDGKLARKGFLTASQLATEPREIDDENYRGREEIEAFLSSDGEASLSRSGDGFQLIIAAAMPYAEELELRKYKVISMAYDKLAKVAKKIKGSTVTPLTGGKI